MSVVIAAGATDVGKVREHNEDNHLVDPHAGMFIVCDGMGGHAAGEVASAEAIRVVSKQWTGPGMAMMREMYAQRGTPELRRKLLQAVRRGVMDAHDEIIAQASADVNKTGMGTTFIGFIIAGGDAIFGHAGDSRAYLVRDDIAMQLSEDHTLLARLEATGVTPSNNRRNQRRWKGVLTNALGIGDATRVATFIVPLCSGDKLLLCSDGITEYLNEAELGQVLVAAPSPARAAQQLVDIALDRGGGDNATAVVIKVVEADETRVPPERRQRDDAALSQCPLFQSLTPQERLRALRITTTREVKAGKSLLPIALGNRVSYIVLEGMVTTGTRDLGPGGVVYPAALLEGSELPAREEMAKTKETSRLLIFRQDDFLELTEEDEELGMKLFDAVAELMRS